MEQLTEILILLAGFLMIAVASNQIAKLFQRIRLPLITGLLVMGILAGPFVLKLIPTGAGEKLFFVNDIALAFIAFAAGAQLYLKELRSRLKSITWMSVGQVVVTFLLGSSAFYLLAGYIPFMHQAPEEVKISASILAGAIFVARSPASAIAVVSELRAKGPFTSTALGVTVVADVLVIILFAVCMASSEAIIHGMDIDLSFILLLVIELGLAFGIGYLLGKALALILSLNTSGIIKTIIFLITGYGIYALSHFVKVWSMETFSVEVYIEPLLICIIGSFVVTNYSKYRAEFLKLLQEVSTPVYVVFFTLTGASMSLDILALVWAVALVLVGVRLLAMVGGGIAGGLLAGDSWRFNRIGWMPYVTQAGVSLGLATVAANEFPDWGPEFFTIVIAVIVVNQLIGPPLFKWAIHHVGESHERAKTPEFDGVRDAIIFGLESQSVALAKQLQEKGWMVKIATRRKISEHENMEDLRIQVIPDHDLDSLKSLEAEKAEAIITMLSDEENFKICELAYEHFGTKDMVVRLNKRFNFDRFHKLGALVVEPSTAIVSLLDHMVRSPHATSLLLGMEEGQDTVELEVLNSELHGLALRDLRLPADIIVLSVTREDHMLISHGYTRLRKGDFVTLVGSKKSLEEVSFHFE